MFWRFLLAWSIYVFFQSALFLITNETVHQLGWMRIDPTHFLIALGFSVIGAVVASGGTWLSGKGLSPMRFDEILVGHSLVDLHYSDWRESLRIREPYRILSVYQLRLDTSEALQSLVRQELDDTYTNKMLVVLGKDAEARTLLCAGCYDARYTYFVHVEVNSDDNDGRQAAARTGPVGAIRSSDCASGS